MKKTKTVVTSFALALFCVFITSPANCQPAPASEPPANLPTIPSASATMIEAVTNSGAVSQHIEKDAALECLKRWLKRKQGKDVKIVDAQDILDLQGKPTCVNVLVTTRLDGLDVDTLKQQLDANAVRERELREELQKAYQETNFTAADQLVAEIRKVRTTFVETNELATYRVSLSEDRPPVLAFWPGLLSDAVREEAARNLAATKLGDDIGFQSLVYYTSATTLLCFTNRAGGSIYIDPFRVLEVSMSEIQSPHPNTDKPDDADVSVSDIAAQWTDFLQP